jgi:hypothetical protein
MLRLLIWHSTGSYGILWQKGYPDHILQIIKYMYEGTATSIDRGINKARRQK